MREVSTEGPSILKVRLILGALIAVIVLQATPATPLPTYREHGSAFSASTSEVALLVRRDSVERSRIAPQPLPLPIIAALPNVVTLDIPLHFRHQLYYQRGPPFDAPVLPRHAPPRAPPIRI